MIDYPTLRHIEQVARDAALKAGLHAKQLREQSKLKQSKLVVQYKGTRDLVTQADVECEEIIVNHIQKHFPDHNILSEEMELPPLHTLSQGPLWVIDPIDGTTNYAHGQHCVGVSIGFALDGKRLVGVVFCPFLDELFSAVKGNGAYLNGQPIRVSSATIPEEALICTGFPYQREDLVGVMHRLRNVLSSFRDLRRLGACSVDICFTACGRIDGFYEDVKPWDVTAGLLIAAEAGAFIGRYRDDSQKFHAWSDPEGQTPEEIDGSNLIVCTPGIAQALQLALDFTQGGQTS